MSTDETEVPDGFELIDDRSTFNLAFGPFYHRRKPQGAVIGLRVAKQHLNRYGNLHGGALSGFLDVAMGMSVLLQPEGPQANLTVSMNIDYIDRGLPGEWLEADVSIAKMGRRLAFVHCQVHAQTRLIARASGVWMLQWQASETSKPAAD